MFDISGQTCASDQLGAAAVFHVCVCVYYTRLAGLLGVPIPAFAEAHQRPKTTLGMCEFRATDTPEFAHWQHTSLIREA